MSVFITGAGDAPFIAKPVFADNTWEDIVLACQAGKVPDTWVVGDSKTMMIDGVDYQIDIIGKYHDVYSDGTSAPLTFQLHGLYATTYRMNGSTGVDWVSTEMRTTTLPTLQSKMPAVVSAAIRDVTKYTYTTSASGAAAHTDKLFLLSEYEVIGRRTYARATEGTQYAYYKNVANLAKGQIWWTRSRNSTSSYYATIVKAPTSESNAAGRGTMTDRNYVSFAFCL